MFNHQSAIQGLVKALDQPQPFSVPVPRRRVTSDPVLAERLPGTGFIEREAENDVPKAVLRQLRRSPTPPLSDGEEGDEEDETQSTDSTSEAKSEEEHRHSRTSSFSSLRSPSLKAVKGFFQPKSPSTNNGPWKEPQAFEVLRAVERRDIMFLMEVRDRAFSLLLRKSGDVTPLLHAMRIGNSHRDVSIVLLGAFSRWVNHLDDEDMSKPKTKTLLKALRANLKLAIDYGLAKSQTDLIASFLQTLIMSEGDRWVWSQVSNISLALRAGAAGEPVKSAEAAVRKFATRELGKAALIAALEDYIANATADLLMMAAWSLIQEIIPEGSQIPAYYFARDDRVYKAFIERLDEHRAPIQVKASKRLKWQLRVLRVVMEGHAIGYRSKVSSLAGELDESDGP